MKKIFILTLLPLVAMANSFIEVKVHDLDLNNGRSNNGRLGAIEYDSAVISKDTLSFNLEDKHKRRSSAEVFYNNRQLKIDNGILSAQFDMGENDFLDKLNTLAVKEIETAITPTYFNINGSHFKIDRDGVELHANNFFLFCTVNDPEYDMASGDGIVKGCMTELNMSPKSYNVPVDFVFIKQLEDNAVFTMKGDIGKLQLQAKRFLTMTSPFSLMNYKQYDVEATGIDLNCEKDEDLLDVDSDKLMHHCENTVALKVPRILVKNSVESTKFYFDIKNLNIKNEKLNFHSDVFQFLDKLKSVTVKDMDVNCQKKLNSDLLDVASMIKECLVDGNIKINKLKTNEDVEKPRTGVRRRRVNNGRRVQVVKQDVSDRYKNSELEEYEPLSNLDFDKSDLSNISINIKNSKAKIRAHAYKNVLLKKNFDVDITASIRFDDKKSQIIMDVEDVVVPFGFIKVKWVWLVEKIIKKAIVGSSVAYTDGKFYITI